ncbi:DUF3781 domain-containing protein [Companilactobacillus sp.]|uniref:DUF3781 domain-containing protein n=1 Tax=Companilactobacillus sp. TaxID=2767905 RepID=UPI00262FA028|nr:DUF3781 domain-containing protein [Companilactobacillus sp.]
MIKQIMENICYTELVFDRINKKLGTDLNQSEIKSFIQTTLKRHDCVIEHLGKNYYVTCPSQYIRLTVNASNYRLITVDRI